MVLFSHVVVLIGLFCVVWCDYFWMLRNPGTHKNGDKLPDFYFTTVSSCLSFESMTNANGDHLSFYYNSSSDIVFRLSGNRNCNFTNFTNPVEIDDSKFSVSQQQPQGVISVGEVTNCNGSYDQTTLPKILVEDVFKKVTKTISMYPVLEYNFPFEPTTKVVLSIFSTDFFLCFAKSDNSCFDYYESCTPDKSSGTKTYDYLTKNMQRNPYGFYEITKKYEILIYFVFLTLPLLTLLIFPCNILFVCIYCMYGMSNSSMEASEETTTFSLENVVCSCFLKKSKFKKFLSPLTLFLNCCCYTCSIFTSTCCCCPLFSFSLLFSTLSFILDFLSWALFSVLTYFLLIDSIDFWVLDFLGILLIELLAFKLVIEFWKSLVFNSSGVLDLLYYWNDVVEDTFIFMLPFLELFSLGGYEKVIKILIFVGWILKFDNLLYPYLSCLCCAACCNPVLDCTLLGLPWKLLEIGCGSLCGCFELLGCDVRLWIGYFNQIFGKKNMDGEEEYTEEIEEEMEELKLDPNQNENEDLDTEEDEKSGMVALSGDEFSSDEGLEFEGGGMLSSSSSSDDLDGVDDEIKFDSDSITEEELEELEDEDEEMDEKSKKQKKSGKKKSKGEEEGFMRIDVNEDDFVKSVSDSDTSDEADEDEEMIKKSKNDEKKKKKKGIERCFECLGWGYFFSAKFARAIYITCCCSIPNFLLFLARAVDILFLICPLISLISWGLYLGAMNTSGDPDKFVEDRQLFSLLLIGVISGAIFASSVANGLSYLADLLLGDVLGKLVWGTIGIIVVLAYLVAESITLYLKVHNATTNPRTFNENNLRNEYMGNMLVSIVFSIVYLAFIPFVALFGCLITPCCVSLRFCRCACKTCNTDKDCPPLKCVLLPCSVY